MRYAVLWARMQLRERHQNRSPCLAALLVISQWRTSPSLRISLIVPCKRSRHRKSIRFQQYKELSGQQEFLKFLALWFWMFVMKWLIVVTFVAQTKQPMGMLLSRMLKQYQMRLHHIVRLCLILTSRSKQPSVTV